MPTLLEILQKTTAYLASKGVPNPKLNAELLLAHALKLRRLDLYLQFDRPLPAEQLDALRPLVQRRGKREPLEYIIGTRPFADVELLCDRRALVPRSETEELVELLAKRLPRPPLTVLDLGTGTGALALALAKTWPQIHVTAIDASDEALQLARANALHNDLQQNVTFSHANWFAPIGNGTGSTTAGDNLPNTSRNAADGNASHTSDTASDRIAAASLADKKFDLIVSNPPYLTEAEWLAVDPEVKDYEPYHALVAAKDGLADLLEILTAAPQFLTSGGLLALETGIAHHHALAQAAAATHAYANTESHCDSDGRPRFFLATAK